MLLFCRDRARTVCAVLRIYLHLPWPRISALLVQECLLSQVDRAAERCSFVHGLVVLGFRHLRRALALMYGCMRGGPAQQHAPLPFAMHAWHSILSSSTPRRLTQCAPTQTTPWTRMTAQTHRPACALACAAPSAPSRRRCRRRPAGTPATRGARTRRRSRGCSRTACPWPRSGPPAQRIGQGQRPAPSCTAAPNAVAWCCGASYISQPDS